MIPGESRNAFMLQCHQPGMCVCMHVMDQCSTLPDDGALQRKLSLVQPVLLEDVGTSAAATDWLYSDEKTAAFFHVGLKLV